MHPTFKFSYENSKQEITFLDVVVFKGARYHKLNILDIKTHTKPTDTFQFLHRESCHPTATFNGFIKGEILRYARTCNNTDDFTKKVAFFTNKLLNREYKNNEITKITKGVDHNTRNTLTNTRKAKTTTNKLIFSTTYSPYIQTKYLKGILVKHWDELKKDTTLINLFPESPTIAYKRNKNLKDSLVKTKFTKEKKNQTHKPDMQTILHSDPNIDILASLLEEQEH